MVFRYVDSYRTHYEQNHLRVVRDRLVWKLRNTSASRDTIYNALLTPANGGLRNCLLDDSIPAGSAPDDCTAGVWQPVTLDRPVPLAGIEPVSSGAGVRYNFTGTPCTLAPTTCGSRTFLVQSEFSAQCTGGTPTCRLANVFSFRFTITPSPDLRGLSVTIMGPAPTIDFQGLTLPQMRIILGSMTRAAIDSPPVPVIIPTKANPDTDDPDEEPITPPINPPPCPYGEVASEGTCRKFNL